MHDTGCLGLVHWDDPEGWYGGEEGLERGLSLHSCSSKEPPLLLTLDKGYLLTAAPSDFEHGIAPLGSPVPWWRDPVEVSRKLPQVEG